MASVNAPELEICATAHLLKEFGLTRTTAPLPSPEPEPLTQWYADLFYLERRKCLFIMNPTSGWVILRLLVSRNDIKATPETFQALVEESIVEGGFPREKVRSFLPAEIVSTETVPTETTRWPEAKVCRTNSRSALAVINQNLIHIPIHRGFFLDLTHHENETRWAMHYNFGPYAGKYRAAYKEMASILGVAKPLRELFAI